MQNNTDSSDNELWVFTEFLKDTCPMIFNNINIKAMMNEFESWKETHTFTEKNHTYIKCSDFDHNDMNEKAAAEIKLLFEKLAAKFNQKH